MNYVSQTVNGYDDIRTSINEHVFRCDSGIKLILFYPLWLPSVEYSQNRIWNTNSITTIYYTSLKYRHFERDFLCPDRNAS